MIDFVNKYAWNQFSQNGEDGLVREARLRIGLNVGHAVEIGANDGHWLSNTRNLIQTWDWSGLFVESDYNLYLKCLKNWKDNPRVRCQCSHVDERNINAFVDESCDVLSIDVDGGDYRIFKGLQVQPKIVIIEIDSSIPPDQWGFNSDGGAGFREMVHEAQVRDYFLLAHTGNLILVRNEYRDLFPEVVGDPLVESEKYFNRGWLKAA